MSPEERQRRVIAVSVRLDRAERDAKLARAELAMLLGDEPEKAAVAPGVDSIPGRALIALRDMGKSATVSEIARYLPEASEDTLRMSLDRLVRSGHLLRPEKGRYVMCEVAR